MTYIVCSNPKCKFSTRGTESSLNYCPWCGSTLISRCPHCNEFLIYKNQLHCVDCGKRIKPLPEKEQKETAQA